MFDKKFPEDTAVGTDDADAGRRNGEAVLEGADHALYEVSDFEFHEGVLCVFPQRTEHGLLYTRKSFQTTYIWGHMLKFAILNKLLIAFKTTKTYTFASETGYIFRNFIETLYRLRCTEAAP